MCGTTGPPAMTVPRCVVCLLAESTGEHPQRHLKSFKGVLQADAYRDLMRCTLTARSGKRHAGRMCGASSLICTKRADCPLQPKQSGELALYTRLRHLSGASRHRNAKRHETPEPALYWSVCTAGCRKRSAVYRRNRPLLRPFAML